jgi:serine/threonine-protein kinase
MAVAAGTAWLYTTHTDPHVLVRVPPLPVVLLVFAIWGTVTVATSTLICSVVYGLGDRVRAALDLGQYTLVAKIGEGGMGRVYRAKHALLRRPTAIKMLAADRNDEVDLRRFEREVQLTSRLSHPNVVSIYDYGRSPAGVFYYAMELLDGVDLQLLVEVDGPQPAARVLHVLRQAADALAEAHAVGLIHRDVKPANLILCPRRRHSDLVKIVDFGLVKSMSSTTGVGRSDDATVLKGTPLYMAPEAILAPEEVDARTDLYALGAVGYFLLSGRPVFEGANLVEVCGQHVHSPVVPIAERSGRAVPATLEAVLMKCLAKKKEERPDAAALLGALETIDGVGRWTDADANAWWKGCEEALTRRRKPPVPAGATFAVADRSPRAS